ncbi:hypothetical protein FCL40_18125 [Ferrimonas sediminicola]|uniref:Protein NO VEIN C-terminal domain-containing protein n=1 Tax=Ferrimonas sediminicola TaxID=2569538 RepID=A0A4U1B712_9GAMM|nr:hypothetical protein [Ferrimonas sediminicola]TKB46212.1 hypothetical protein FCL40_18125 [Ferrimonas sediminicola]
MTTERTPKSVIDEHIDTKLETLRRDPQTAIGHIRQERSVRNDYMGRAPFELLQNALDRASSKVRLKLCRETKSFSVANDGVPFSFQTEQSDSWSDFAALCAVNSSNKEVGKSIGNKGVGFRSVWEFCPQVQIVSCLADSDECWGFQLNFPFVQECLSSWADKEKAEEISRCINILPKEKGQAPSFYFPKYLPEAALGEVGVVTEVTLQGLSEKKLDRLEKLLSKLADSPLMFSGFASNHAKLGNLKAEFDISGSCRTRNLRIEEHSHHLVEVDTSELVSSSYKHVLEAIDYSLTRKPQLFLAIPNSLSGPDDEKTGAYHCYLPTELSTGCPLHIHADFYVDNSRKHIDFQDIEYNSKLISLAANALLAHFDEHHASYAIPVISANLMPSSGKLKEALQHHFKSGEKLASLIQKLLTSRLRPSFDDIEALWALIGHYSPERGHGGHWERYDRELARYFANFSRVDLELVPLSVRDKAATEVERPQCVQIPEPSVEEDARAELFCLSRATTVSPISAIGVTVTPWRFPAAVRDNLKRVNVWRGYEESLSVIRAIIRSQKKHEADEHREQLLQAAAIIDPIRNELPQIRMVGIERHRSHALLVPADCSSGWAPASECYLQSDLLDRCLESTPYYRVDERRAQQYLGENYKHQLAFWGVWQVLPIKRVGKASEIKWNLVLPARELLSILSPAELLENLAQCFEFWQRCSFFIQKRDSLHEAFIDLYDTEWLEATQGKEKVIASPARTFNLSGNQVLSHVPFICREKLPSNHEALLRWLLVRDIEQESNINKLTWAANCITSQLGPSKPRSVSREYRLVITRLNSLRSQIDKKLNDFPRLVKDKSGVRLAGQHEVVYFLTAEERRRIRGSNRLEIPLLDVPRDTSIELVQKLRLINRFTPKPVIEPALDTISGAPDQIEYMAEKVLPKLFAYADIAEEISRDPDEDKIKERWGAIDIRVANEGCDVVVSFQDPEENVISSASINQNKAVWFPATNASKAAILILHTEFDWESHHDLKALSKWMAQEVFRMTELQQGFAMTLLGETEIEPDKVDEHRSHITGWLSLDDETELVANIEGLLGKKLEKGAWRLLSTYQGASLTYSRLKQSLPEQLIAAIEHLDPRRVNSDSLKRWLAENKSKLEHLGDLGQPSFESLIEGEKLDDFDFEPGLFVLTKLGIEQSEFNKINESLAPELSELQRRSFEVGLPTKKIPTTPTKRFETVSRIGSGTGRLVKARAQSVHAAESEAKAENGLNAESQIAIQYAQATSDLTVEQQEIVYELVANEYRRLLNEHRPEPQIAQHIDTLLSLPKPSSAKAWYDFLHIGKSFDGCGYDVLGFEAERGHLLLVEVKHSSQEPPVIYLSENERRCVIRFASDDFKSVCSTSKWRLYLTSERDETKDCTAEVIHAVTEHDISYSQIVSDLKSTEWRLQIKDVG